MRACAHAQEFELVLERAWAKIAED